MIRIDIITVFPEMVRDALNHSIVKRAMDRGLADIRVINLRDHTRDRHKTTDDVPYGGGGGMVMKIEPIARALLSLGLEPDTQSPAVDEAENAAIDSEGVDDASSTDPEMSLLAVEELKARCSRGDLRIILTDPRGPVFNQETARRWAGEKRIVLLCGHYEGVDERVRRHLITDEVSIGDYVLTGGELPALVITDALTRLQEGALGDAEAPNKDSFADNLLEYPHYTRPRDFLGWSVPDILLCGHHAQIDRWRRWQQLQATHERRPDLLNEALLSLQDRKLLTAPEPAAPTDEKAMSRNNRVQSAYEKYEETDGTGI